MTQYTRYPVQGSGSAVTTIGSLDGGSTSANGASISTNSLFMQSASASFPGLVNTTTQTMAGAKTFSTSVSSPTWKITGSTSGTLTVTTASTTTNYAIVFPSAQGAMDTFLKNDGSGGLSWAAGSGASGVSSVGAYDSQASNPDGSVIVGTTIYFQSATATNPGMINATTQTMAGAKTFSTSLSSPIFSTTAANPASAGTIRLSNTQLIAWANAAHSGNVTLSVDASDIAQFSGAVNAGGNITGANLSGTNTGDQTITLTGDITGSGTGSFATTLATVNGNVGTFGSSTSIPTVTVNAKGLVTAASGNVVIAPAGTLTGTTLAANVVNSSLTGVGIVASGTWNGTKISEIYGGTNQSTYTTGDILYASSSNTLSKLGIGSTNYVLSVVAGVPAWQAASASIPTSPMYAVNFGLATSVGGNALTITLKNNAANNPSSGDPVQVAFRSTTLATGQYSIQSYTGATSITVSSGAELGLTSAAPGYIYVWAIYDGSNLELAVSGSRREFSEGALYNTTQMASSSDTYNVLYSTTARTGVAIRCLGRLLLTETTAGTYASNVTSIELYEGYPWPDVSQPATLGSLSIDGCGTLTNIWAVEWRVGMTYFMKANCTLGTVSATTAAVVMPTGRTIDTNFYSSGTDYVGEFQHFGGNSNVVDPTNTTFVRIFKDPSNDDKVFLTYTTSTGAYTKHAANDWLGTGKSVTFQFMVYVKEFRSY